MNCKKYFLLTIIIYSLILSCSVKVKMPNWSEDVLKYMNKEDYSAVLDILENKKIANRQKVDWWYYDYAVCLYKLYPSKVRYAIPMLENANAFTENDSAILYHLGKCFYEIGEYEKSIEYFSASLNRGHKDYLCFLEKTSAEFWIIILNYLNGNDSIAEDLLMKSTNEAHELKCLRQIRKGEITLNDICNDTELLLEEKLLCINFYFNKLDEYDRTSFYAKSCEEIVLKCDKQIAFYLNAYLIFFYLAMDKIDSVENLLKDYGQYPLYLIDSEEPIINERFYKYLSFYFWKKRDAIMANNTLEIFKRYHFKPVDFKSQGSDRLENISEFFNQNVDFKVLLE